MKIGRNAECPCGGGSKFKSCCLGKVDWEATLNRGTVHDVVTRLTARGKNLLFGRKISGILQLDRLPHDVAWSDVKRAMTGRAVREIYEALMMIWPTGSDLARVLTLEKDRHNALYVGSYQPASVARGLGRHSLYSDAILMIDPFLHPARLAARFNPLEHPEEHRANALAALRLWMTVGPWIDSGLVKVIRSPTDFDGDLHQLSFAAAEDRLRRSAELRDLLGADTHGEFDPDGEYREFLFLTNPDETIVEIARERDPGVTPEEIEEILTAVRTSRDNHPFYVDFDSGTRARDFLSFSTGASYDIAKLIASDTNAHLVTDIDYRWKEIELDRADPGVDPYRWSAFAKALQNVNLRFINNSDLQAAKRLREEQRLEGLRAFFRKVWRTVSKDDSFSEALAVDLASELVERTGEAEAEWAKIDQDLFRWFGSEAAAAGVIVATGHGNLFGAAVGTAAAGVANLLHAHMKRRTFPRLYPAAFFIGV